MKITLSRDEITEILQKKAQQIGEDCCADDQIVLDVRVPDIYHGYEITIEIGARNPPMFKPFTPPSPAAEEEVPY